MKKTHIIGDIAGEYVALMRLIDKLGPGKIVLVGDLNDRGLDSKSVIEWALRNQDWVTTLHSNHGHMFTEWYEESDKFYSRLDFVNNGGSYTVRSYGSREDIPIEHITFLKTRPLFTVVDEKVMVTHAPVDWEVGLGESLDINSNLLGSVLWNRGPVAKKEGIIQVFGHNAHWGLKFFDSEVNPYAICLDASRSKVLTAWTYPDGVITQEPYE